MPFEVYTRQEVSDQFKIPLKTIDYMVRTGQIPFFRPTKRSVRFEASALEKWMRERQNVEYRLGGH